MIRRLLGTALLLLALAAAPAALGSEQRPTLTELENEITCPTCKTLLALSNAPVAEQIRGFIRERIAAGDTKSEIKDKLVAEFGPAVLAAPPRSGFNLLAWVLPFVGLAAAALAVAVLVRRWLRVGGRGAKAGESPEDADELDPALANRVDEELARFE